jgi:hydroxypyruvate isomerase
MPRFAANLTMLFTEAPILSRPALARQAGFDGVEVLFPYDHPASEWKDALDGLPLALINTPPGNWAAGDRGYAAQPNATDEFRSSFLRAAEVARELGAGGVHIMAGLAHGPDAETTFRANLAWAAEQAPELPLTIEPLNPLDVPGYFLHDFDQAVRVLDDLALPNLGLQFDLWHALRIHGDPEAVWARHRSRVRHIQIAGFPGRHEPGGTGFDLARLCAELDRDGYPGWVAAEYVPAGKTADGLGWLDQLRHPENP